MGEQDIPFPNHGCLKVYQKVYLGGHFIPLFQVHLTLMATTLHPFGGEPGFDMAEHGMAVGHHGADGGGAGGETVSAVIDGDEVEAGTQEKGRQFVVVGDDLAVAVEEEDVRGVFGKQVAFPADLHVFSHGDQGGS